MAAASFEDDTVPATGGNVSVTTASSTAGSGNLSAWVGQRVRFSTSVSAGVNIRFGTASVGAATAGDFFIGTNVMPRWKVVPGRTHFRVRAVSGTGRLFYNRAEG